MIENVRFYKGKKGWIVDIPCPCHRRFRGFVSFDATGRYYEFQCPYSKHWVPVYVPLDPLIAGDLSNQGFVAGLILGGMAGAAISGPSGALMGAILGAIVGDQAQL